MCESSRQSVASPGMSRMPASTMPNGRRYGRVHALGEGRDEALARGTTAAGLPSRGSGDEVLKALDRLGNRPPPVAQALAKPRALNRAAWIERHVEGVARVVRTWDRSCGAGRRKITAPSTSGTKPVTPVSPNSGRSLLVLM